MMCNSFTKCTLFKINEPFVFIDRDNTQSLYNAPFLLSPTKTFPQALEQLESKYSSNTE